MPTKRHCTIRWPETVNRGRRSLNYRSSRPCASVLPCSPARSKNNQYTDRTLMQPLAGSQEILDVHKEKIKGAVADLERTSADLRDAIRRP